MHKNERRARGHSPKISKKEEAPKFFTEENLYRALARTSKFTLNIIRSTEKLVTMIQNCTEASRARNFSADSVGKEDREGEKRHCKEHAR